MRAAVKAASSQRHRGVCTGSPSEWNMHLLLIVQSSIGDYRPNRRRTASRKAYEVSTGREFQQRGIVGLNVPIPGVVTYTSLTHDPFVILSQTEDAVCTWVLFGWT